MKFATGGGGGTVVNSYEKPYSGKYRSKYQYGVVVFFVSTRIMF